MTGADVSGVLVLLDENGHAAAASAGALVLEGDDTAIATLREGAQLVFRANARYADAIGGAAQAEVASFDAAAIDALARGHLVGELTSEFSTGAALVSQSQHIASAELLSATN